MGSWALTLAVQKDDEAAVEAYQAIWPRVVVPWDGAYHSRAGHNVPGARSAEGDDRTGVDAKSRSSEA